MFIATCAARQRAARRPEICRTGRSYIRALFAMLAAVCLLFLFTARIASAGVEAGPPGPERRPGAPDAATAPAARTTVTFTNWLYLPALSRASQFRALGQVNVVSGPTSCSGQSCYTVSVSCPGVYSGISAVLKVGSPISQPYRGTWVFFSGWNGASFWEEWDLASRVITETRQAGFQTVQVKWSSNWFAGSIGRLEGEARLACRAASVLNWVDKSLPRPAGGGFCAYGNSNGASEVAYAAAQYGLAPSLDAVLFESGPNWSRLDLACLWEGPANQPLWYGDTERRNVDLGFGLGYPTSGPCFSKDQAYRSVFQEASVAYGPWATTFPRTLIHFAFGELDTSSTRAHGEYYYSLLASAGTPLLRRDVVPGAPHVLTETSQGADFIRDSLINDCVPR